MHDRTFDDVLLKPQYSEVVPSDIDLTMWLGDYKMAIPIISSPMDTITGQSMAIALAQQGGLGVVHRNMSPDKQSR